VIWFPAFAAFFIAQMEWQLDERIRHTSWTVEMHTTQLEALADRMDEMEDGGTVEDRNLYDRIVALENAVIALREQVRHLMRWEPWLLRVYRWWYGSATPA
jgi:hypothetical protein